MKSKTDNFYGNFQDTKYFKEYIFKFIALGINSIFTFFIINLTVQKLNIVEFGNFNLFISITSLISVLIHFGVPNYVFKHFFENEKYAKVIFSNSFYLNCLFSIVAILLLFSILISNDPIYLNQFIVMGFLFVISRLFDFSWYYNISRLQIVNVTKSFLILALTLLLTIFFLNNDNYFYFFLIIYIVNFILDFTTFFIYKPVIVPFNFSRFLTFLKNVLPFSIISFSTLIFVNSDIYLIGFLLTREQLGYYTFSVKIYFIIKNLISIIITASQPKISYLSKNNFTEFSAYTVYIISFLILIFSSFIPFLIININDLIVFFGGFNYIEGARFSLIILIFSLIFSILAWAFNYLIQINIGKEKQILFATILSGIINIFLNIFFLGKYGIVVAALTTLLSEFVIFILAFLSIKKVYKPQVVINYRRFLFSIIISLISFIFLNLILNYNFGLNFIVKSLLNLLLFIVFLYLFEKIFKVQYLNKLLDFIK